MGGTRKCTWIAVSLLAIVMAFACAPAAFANPVDELQKQGIVPQALETAANENDTNGIGPDLLKTTATLAGPTAYSYTGQEIKPSFTVTLNGKTLAGSQDFQDPTADFYYFYMNNVNIGNSKTPNDDRPQIVLATFSDDEPWVYTKSIYFNIIKTSIADATVAVPSRTYTGKKVTPPVSVKFNGMTLKKGIDYTVKYSNNLNAGTATATITGKGSYKGQKSATFKIEKANFAKAVLSKVSNATYTGTAITPAVTVKFNGKKLKKDTDYTVKYSNNLDVGTAKITVTGKGNFKGQKNTTFKIEKTSIARASYSKVKNATYTGKAITPNITLKFNGKKLKKDTDYTVAYRNNINAGTAKLTVYGKGDYKGQRTISFKINKASIAKAAVSKIAGKTYAKAKIKPVPRVKFNGKSLKKGTDFTVKYKNNVNVGTATIIITGKGNFKGKTKTTFKIRKGDIANASFSRVGDRTFTGSGIKPAITVTYRGKNLKKGTDYKVSYSNNRNVGIATMTIKGTNNMKGSHSIEFVINARPITDTSYSVGSAVWTGGLVAPKIVLKFAGGTLKAGRDYSVYYSNNIEVGTGTAYINARGNYTGTRAFNFTIGRRPITSSYGVSAYWVDPATGQVISNPTYLPGSNPRPTVTYNGRYLVYGTDYTLRWSEPADASTMGGTGTVTIVGMNHFTSSRMLGYNIRATSATQADAGDDAESGSALISAAMGEGSE